MSNATPPPAGAVGHWMKFLSENFGPLLIVAGMVGGLFYGAFHFAQLNQELAFKKDEAQRAELAEQRTFFQGHLREQQREAAAGQERMLKIIESQQKLVITEVIQSIDRLNIGVKMNGRTIQNISNYQRNLVPIVKQLLGLPKDKARMPLDAGVVKRGVSPARPP